MLITTYTSANTNKAFSKNSKTSEIPVILTKEDIKIYKSIFSLQKDGQWVEAKKLKRKINNDILIGYLEYDKLMHPNKYKASYEELSDWFEVYKDYPPVLRRRVYSLLLKRLPEQINKDKYEKPIFGKYLRGYGEDRRKIFKYNTKKSIKLELKKKINNYMMQANHIALIEYLNANYPNEGYAYKLIGKNIDKLFYKGELQDSLKLYDFYIKALKINQPEFLFRAGVNSYKVKGYKKSKDYLNRCIQFSLNSDKWLKSACLYWASMVEDSLTKRSFFLKEAASYPRTIYGQLAIEKLNLSDPFVWIEKEDNVKLKTFDNLNNNKILSRLLALSEIKLYNKADLETRNLYSLTSKSDLKNLFFLSEELNLAAVLIRLGAKFSKSDTNLYIRGLYPTPEWDIKEGFVLDRALLFALIRRESAFNFRAKSSKGARGLMQLMPRTASKLEKDYRLRYANKDNLYSMELNLKIGQNFLKDLITNQHTKNSILDTLIAYNAGMSRLQKWKKTMKENDPIVFIESIPIKETRWFVKYILTDLWIYRDKLGQEKPSRILLANKKWPVYKSLDYNYIKDAKAR
ncbi:lytic transglycosylase domain-containing protein [Alphaproteobacteria bacterium]|nr:lytic transglycosylase domain-containing protein [Alphaproteobacteria bacterium]